MSNGNTILKKLEIRAQNLHNKIALVDGDKRVTLAVHTIIEKKIAIPVLVGKRAVIENEFSSKDLMQCEIVDTDKLKEQFIEKYKNRIRNPHYYSENSAYIAAMLVETGYAAGAVGGADCPTADMARAALKIVGTVKNSPMSGAFLMISEDKKIGCEGVFIFSDCAVVPRPTSYQLACITSDAADLAKSIGIDPIAALLSYSTNLSAKGEEVDRIRDALKFLKTSKFTVDGEMQLDAAIVPNIAKKKYPESSVAGNANILIFPDLNSGNIGYKLAERIGKMKAIGPLFLGIKKPFNDLSRGCSSSDIVNLVAVTSVMACH
ncbi:MAG: phosphate acetyltransferase [Epsilonproteobacteria bacterium]|nr:phosphate acetyltransferase [Campylobacterota bacterium]